MDSLVPPRFVRSALSRPQSSVCTHDACNHRIKCKRTSKVENVPRDLIEDTVELKSRQGITRCANAACVLCCRRCPQLLSIDSSVVAVPSPSATSNTCVISLKTLSSSTVDRASLTAGCQLRVWGWRSLDGGLRLANLIIAPA